MKRLFSSRPSLSLAASAAFIAAGLATAPVLRAQQATPEPTATATPSGQEDIFDAIKKGADKLQKEAKEQKELAPEIKALNQRLTDVTRHQIEQERRVQSNILKQQEEIQALEKTVAKLEKECAECMAKPSPTPEAAKPSATLPMTEPTPKPTPTPSPTPSATPTPTAAST
jgi:Skp family chaperone for outer membrane proteins